MMTADTTTDVFAAEDLSALQPPGRRFWVTPDMIRIDSKKGLPVPFFSVDATAKVFFGRSQSWLRLHMSDGRFTLDGKPVEPHRGSAYTAGDPPRLVLGTRAFSLADIEPMAWSAARCGIIDASRLANAIFIVKGIARQHGILRD